MSISPDHQIFCLTLFHDRGLGMAFMGVVFLRRT